MPTAIYEELRYVTHPVSTRELTIPNVADLTEVLPPWQRMATRSRLHKPPYTLTHPPIRPLRSRHERTSESSESAASFIWGGLVTKFYTYPEPTRVSVRVCNRTGPIKILHFGLFGRFLMCAIGSKLTSPFRATERRIISNACKFFSIGQRRTMLTAPAVNVSTAAMPRPIRGAASTDRTVNSRVIMTAPEICPANRAVACMPPPLRSARVEPQGT
jgi:hypothetical protein